jgi:hypothetical protein
MDLRDYKPGDKFITRSGQTVTLDAFYPEQPLYYQVRFAYGDSLTRHFYTDTSGREMKTLESAHDIMRPAPIRYKFGDLLRLRSGELALYISGDKIEILVVRNRDGYSRWISATNIKERLSSHPEVPRTYATTLTVVKRVKGTLADATRTADNDKEDVVNLIGGSVTSGIKEV